jgi:large subunit ribosomal protein L32
MAVPFRKVSKTRRDMRRTHYKVTANGLVECSNCHEMTRPHRACPKCGYYKGKEVMSKEDKAA